MKDVVGQLQLLSRPTYPPQGHMGFGCEDKWASTTYDAIKETQSDWTPGNGEKQALLL